MQAGLTHQRCLPCACMQTIAVYKIDEASKSLDLQQELGLDGEYQDYIHVFLPLFSWQN